MKNTNKKVTIKDNNSNQPLSSNVISTTGKSVSKHQTVLSQPKVFGNRVSSSQTISNNYKKTSTKKQQGTPKTNKGSFVNNPITNSYATTNLGIKRTTRLKQSSIVSSITGSVNYNHKSSIQSTDFSKTPFAGELKHSGMKVPDEEVLIVHVHNHTESNVTNKNHSKQTSPYLKKNKTKQIYNTAKASTNTNSNTKSISNGLFADINNVNSNNYATKTHTTEEDDNSPTKHNNNNNMLPTTQTFTETTQDNNNINAVLTGNNVATPKTSRIVSKEHSSFTHNLGVITQTKSTPNLVNHTFNININNNNAVIIPSCAANPNDNNNNSSNNVYSHSNEVFLQKILEMFISLKPNISNNNEDILSELFRESQSKFKELENKINSIIITNSINHKHIQTQQDYINEIYLNSQTRIEIYKTYFEFIYNILNEIKYITTREINHDLILKQIDEVNSNTKSKLTNTCNVNESVCEEKTNLILPMGNIFLNNKQVADNELSEFISSIHSEFYQKLIFDDEKKKPKANAGSNNNNNINHLDDTPLQYSKKNFFPKKKNSQKSCDSNDQTIKMSEDDYSSTIIKDDDSIKESIVDNNNNNNKCTRKVNEIHPNQIINQVNINQNRKQFMKYSNNNNNNNGCYNYSQVGRNVKPPLQKGKTNDNNENNCIVF